VRKNYFYPDLPKGYQISQYALPLVSGGTLSGIAITRVHLEEDTARSVHHGGHSLVDYNRAGVPLMELVTEPVIQSAKEAADFARELQLLLLYLSASEANMEKGEMRVEANVSVSVSNRLGTKVEIKNLNSFRAVERAIEYEIKRQTALLERGERVAQETRGWDDVKGVTLSQRSKEESHDYRYFAEPDVPVYAVASDTGVLPELPWERRERYTRLGLKKEQAELLTMQREVGDFFDAAARTLDEGERTLAANYVISDVLGLRTKTGVDNFGTLSPKHFAELIHMLAVGDISSRVGKDILAELFIRAIAPRALATERGLLQQSGPEELARAAEKICAVHSRAVGDYRAGKREALAFLVGQGMKEMKGAAHPKKLREALKNALETA
jgi:aspartyl-tRNA(Asn)/glutamyl-tRNA(Gln) amidotransferase subunit B